MTRSSVCFFVCLLAGCSGLYDETYRGEVVRVIDSRAIADAGPDLTVIFNQTRVAMFWYAGSLAPPPPLDAYTEQPGTSIPLDRSGPFSIELRDTPGPEFWTEVQGSTVALGALLAYEDVNGNEVYDPEEEEFVGISRGMTLIYVPEDIPSNPAISLPLAAGFHEILSPIRCGPPRPLPDIGPACDVPLGAPCDTMGGTECGTGVCLSSQITPSRWPEGYCAIEAPPGEDVMCTPGPAQWYAAPPPPTNPAPPTQYLIAGCSSDADCERPEGTYRCEPWLGACVPRQPIDLTLGDRPLMPPCQPPPGGMPPPP